MTHTLRIADPAAGDLSYTWDPTNDDAGGIAVAEKEFDAAVKERGHSAFEVKSDGKLNRIEKFDPTVEETLTMPPLVGG